MAATGKARAAELAAVPARTLGMGGALRGAATGAAAPLLNPSGISLLRSYVVEAGYQYQRPDAGQIGNVAIVDSTSGFNLGGAVYYTYAQSDPDAAADRNRHEGGVSLCLPFGDRLLLGGTVRYVRARVEGAAGAPAQVAKGVTFDVGITIRPTEALSLGLVGYGLRDLETAQAPLAFGAGVAFNPTSELVIALDGVLDATTYDGARGNVVSVMGGAEYTFASRWAVRAGGGHDGLLERGYGSLGASLVGEVGAIDLGVRQELSGDSKATFVGLAGRLFVPAP